jgi:putative transposase
MARPFYSEINLHLTWHVKHNLPMLTPEVEEVAHRLLRAKACSMPGVFFHEVGGTEDHVHLVVSVLPTVLVCDLIGQLKGYSAHEVNVLSGQGDKVLAWQNGYGVVSFGTRNLPWVLRYVRNQKEHHARQTTHERLELVSEAAPEPSAEPASAGFAR